MSKGIGTPENKEKAFALFREFGGRNVPKILQELASRHGIKVRTSTFYEWKRDGSWDERMKRADAEKEDVADLSFDEKMLRALIIQQENYEQYFRGNPAGKPDTNAMHAYTNLVRTIFEIKAKLGAYKSALFLDFMKDLIEWLTRNEPTAVITIENVFDDFMAYAREKYGA